MGIYKRANSPYYQMRWREHGRLICKSTHQINKLAAEIVYSRARQRIMEGKAGIERNIIVYFDHLAEKYLEYSKENKGSSQRDLYSIAALNTYFSGKIIENITPSDITKYQGLRKDNVSPACINREVSLLRSMINWAIKERDPEFPVKTNPLFRIQMLFEDNEKNEAYTEEERSALFKELHGEALLMAQVAYLTGLRKNDAASLQWENIDWINRTFTVRLHKVRKTKAWLTAPFGDSLYNILYEIRKKSGPVFAIKDPREAIKGASKRAGIKKRLRPFHALRHSFVTDLLNLGVPMEIIAKLLGASDINVLYRRYGHPNNEVKREAVNLLSVAKSITEGKTGKDK